MPEGAEQIFDWFWRIRKRLKSGMNGPEPIGYADLEGFMRLSGEVIEREEAELIFDIDDAYLAAVQEEHDASNARENNNK